MSLISGLHPGLEPGLYGGLDNIPGAVPYPDISVAGIVSAGDTVDKLVFDTASVAVGAREKCVVLVYHSCGTEDKEPTTVVGDPAGTAVSFTRRGGFLVAASNNRRCTVWDAPIGAFIGIVRITYPTGAGANISSCLWSVVRISAGASNDARLVQVGAGATGTGVDVDSDALTAFGNVKNLCVGWSMNANTNTFAADAPFTELAEVPVATPSMTLQTQWAANRTVSNATMSASSAWGAIAVEVGAVV